MIFIPKTNDELTKAVDTYGEINTWNTINITSMENLFKNKINFNDNISNWDTSKVIIMKNMFYGCEKFNQDLDKWNLNKLINCDKMFHGCCSYSYPLFSWTDYAPIRNTQIFNRTINKKTP